MVVQPRTLLTAIFSVTVLLVGAVVYMIFFRGSDPQVSPGSPSVGAVESEEMSDQVLGSEASLFDLAEIGNLVRVAYEQKKMAGEKDPELICGDLFAETDLALLSQNLSVDTDQVIDAAVEAERSGGRSAAWPECIQSCTCSTLASLLEKGLQAGLKIDPESVQKAQAEADAMTFDNALQCAQGRPELCSSALVMKYVNQAATIE